jgi:hypothetical protein
MAIVAMGCLFGGCRGGDAPEQAIERYTAAITLSIPSGRPRLFFSDPNRLAQARAWATSTGFTPNASDPEELALHYLLTGNTTSARTAINQLMALQINTDAGVTASDSARWNGQWAILTFDWCNDQMTPTERSTIISRWNTIVANLNAKSWGGQGMEADNYFWGYYRNGLMWAIASWHENQPSAQSFLDHAIDTRWTAWAKPYLTNAAKGKGGVPHEGSQYGEYMLGYIDVPDTTSAAMGMDIWNDSNYYKEALIALMYQTTPAPTTTSRQPTVRYEPFSFSDDQFFGDQWAARLKGKNWGAFVGRAVDRWRGIPLGHYAQDWLNTIVPTLPKYAQSVHTPISPVSFTRSNLPLDYHAVGNSHVFLHNNWTAAASAINLQLGRARNTKFAHEHSDWGSFQMWRGGRWLTRETTGYSQNITGYAGGSAVDVSNAVAHNMVLFEGLAMISRNELTQGSPVLLRLQSDVNHAYAAVDLSQAYRHSDPFHPERDNKYEQSLVREFLFIRPMETLVVFDRMESSSELKPAASVVKTELLHFETNPTINAGARAITAVNGSQVLEVRTLLPTATAVTYRTVTEGGVGQFRVELDTSGTAQTYFLNVLQGRDSADAAVTASVVDNGTSYDVTITHPTKGTASISYQKGMTSTGGSFGWAQTGTPALSALLTRVQGMSVNDNGPVWESLDGPPSVTLTSPSQNATVSEVVTLQATASDVEGPVAGVQFKVDGNNVGPEDTSAPYAADLDTVPLSNGTHTLTAVARDGAGQTTPSSVTVTVSNDCFVVSGTGTIVRHDAFTTPSTPFTARATVVPAAAMDGGVGLTAGTPTGWSNGASNIVLFTPDGFIRAYNGTTAQYMSDIPGGYVYQAGSRYRVRVVTDTGTQKYSVWITPEGGSEFQLASNYGYRFAATTLDHRMSRCETGQLQVCNFRVSQN